MLTALLLLIASVASPAAPPPEWTAPPPGTYPEAMAVTGVVQVSGVELRSPDDRVAAFVGGEVRGVAGPTLVGNRRMFLLSVAGASGDGAVSFRAYHADEDRVVDLGPDLSFDPLRPSGTASDPVVWTPLAGGGPPVWFVDPARFSGSMSVTARVSQAGVDVVEAGARVGAFVDGDLRGSAPLQRVGAFGTLALLPIYGDAGEAGAVTFRVYLPSADRAFRLTETVPLALETRVGSAVAPLGLTVVQGPTLAGTSGWRMLAPAGADASFDLALGPIWTQGFAGSDAPGGDPTVLRYDETTGEYLAPSVATATWPRGSGRFVWVFEDDDPTTPALDGGFPKVLPAVGLGPSGPFTFPLQRTPASRADDGPGWNLLGNPFALEIDWDLTWTKAGLSNSVYVWDPNYLGGAYRIWNGVVGSLADGRIPAGHGFWVEATGADPVLTVFEGAQVGSPARSGRGATPEAHVIELRLTSDERDDVGAEAYVLFQPGASPPEDGRDPLDAWVLDPLVPDPLTLGSAARSDGRLLAIDARPPPTSGAVEIPLAVRAMEGGQAQAETLRLRWPRLDVPEGWTVSLLDTDTGERLDMRAGGEVRFTSPGLPPARVAGRRAAPGLQTGPRPVLSRAAVDGRFRLEVVARSAVATAPDAPAALSLAPPAPNPSAGEVAVTFTLREAAAVRLTLYDVLGRRVLEWAGGTRGPGAHTVVVDGSRLPAGTYGVRLAAGGEVRASRLTILR